MNQQNEQAAEIHTGVKTEEGTPAIAIVHPAADPKHPDHDGFLHRLKNALGDAAFATGVLAVTHSVLRVGIYAHDHKDKDKPLIGGTLPDEV